MSLLPFLAPESGSQDRSSEEAPPSTDIVRPQIASRPAQLWKRHPLELYSPPLCALFLRERRPAGHENTSRVLLACKQLHFASAQFLDRPLRLPLVPSREALLPVRKYLK